MKYILQGITLAITIYFIVIIHLSMLDTVGIIYKGNYTARTLADALVGAGLISIMPLAIGVLLITVIENSYELNNNGH